VRDDPDKSSRASSGMAAGAQKLDLDPSVIELAESYVAKGDVWRFLRDVDLEIYRYQKDAETLRAREVEFTDTFIEQVRG
jgi:hypothetical protein